MKRVLAIELLVLVGCCALAAPVAASEALQPSPQGNSVIVPVTSPLALEQQVDPLLGGDLNTHAVVADGEDCLPAVCTGQPVGSHCDPTNLACICIQEIHWRSCEVQ